MTEADFAPKLRRFLLIALIVIIIDVATKQLALKVLFSPPQILKVTSFFNLVPVWNSGVSFGLFADYPVLTKWAVPALALIVIGWLISELRRANLLVQIGSGFIAGGAIGNVIDRIRFNKVVDFLDFHIAGYHWPAFNIADSAIFVGAFCWLYAMVTAKDHTQLKQTEDED